MYHFWSTHVEYCLLDVRITPKYGTLVTTKSCGRVCFDIFQKATKWLLTIEAWKYSACSHETPFHSNLPIPMVNLNLNQMSCTFTDKEGETNAPVRHVVLFVRFLRHTGGILGNTKFDRRIRRTFAAPIKLSRLLRHFTEVNQIRFCAANLCTACREGVGVLREGRVCCTYIRREDGCYPSWGRRTERN